MPTTKSSAAALAVGMKHINHDENTTALGHLLGTKPGRVGTAGAEERKIYPKKLNSAQAFVPIISVRVHFPLLTEFGL